jgi:N-acetyltransferase 10
VVTPLSSDSIAPQEAQELVDLKAALRDTNPAGPLVKVASTIDQAKAVMTFIAAIQEKSLRTTVSLTAGRGRGKSAALGLAISAAVSLGYSNIFVTSPSPENLKTLFEFVFKGFDALGLIEHNDYDLVQATNPEFGKAIVRVNIFKSHRQTIQYISPKDSEKLGQAELVVIDEAAAIPLPMVQKLLGPYLVFLSSTINGYEGTGRSLSLKLIKKLREQSTVFTSASASEASVTTAVAGRTLKEVELNEPIRYASGDRVEKWLNGLLCLNASCPAPKAAPHPSHCQLFYVSRDALFSYHQISEEFLQRLMGLFVSSHYKNTPNDLQLLSDAPAHHIFALCAPPDDESKLPDVFAAIQVSLEGQISKATSRNSFGESGDLIPWTLKQQFLDDNFPSLSGARVVRIATHPEHDRMGYGTRALELLYKYYNGEITCVDEVEENVIPEDEGDIERTINKTSESNLLTEKIAPRKKLPPLLLDLSQRRAEQLHYMGTSFGLNQLLLNFWAKNGLKPVYLRQVPSDITGEYSCIMLKTTKNAELAPVDGDGDWLETFAAEFRTRFSNLLSFEFRSFSATLALSMFVDSDREQHHQQQVKPLTRTELLFGMSEYDLRRLDAYAQKLVDYHLIVDLLPQLSRWALQNRIPVKLTGVQRAILAASGLQCKRVDSLAAEFKIETNQLLALFNKSIRKISSFFYSIMEKQAEAEFEEDEKRKEEKGEKENNADAATIAEDTKQSNNKKTQESQNFISMLNLQNYSIAPTEKQLAAATKGNTPNVVNFQVQKVSQFYSSTRNL